MNPNQTAPKVQSDLGPYYLQYKRESRRQQSLLAGKRSLSTTVIYEQ